MVDKSLGYWVGAKSWAVQRPLTRAPEKEQGTAQELIEYCSSRGVVLGLMNGRQAVSQRCHITGMGANYRTRCRVKQRRPLGNY
jgi:hypothetical protein